MYLEVYPFLDKDQGYLLFEGGEHRTVGENDIILVVREEDGSQSFILPPLQRGHIKRPAKTCYHCDTDRKHSCPPVPMCNQSCTEKKTSNALALWDRYR